MGSDSWRCIQTERHQLNRNFLFPSFSLTAFNTHLLQPDDQEQRI
jgi:hypothetical protein